MIRSFCGHRAGEDNNLQTLSAKPVNIFCHANTFGLDLKVFGPVEGILEDPAILWIRDPLWYVITLFGCSKCIYACMAVVLLAW